MIDMNYGPLEFAAHLRRHDARDRESAEVRAARLAAPGSRGEAAKVDKVGVCEAIVDAGCGAIRAPVRVVVSATEIPVVLVLSTHRPVVWRIERHPGASLAAVLLAGCGESQLEGADGLPVGSVGGFCGFRRGSSQYRHLEREVLRSTGRLIATLTRVYATSEFAFGAA